MVLVFRFLQGGAGSVGATLVGGSLADVWAASERGGKMAFFTLMAVGGTSFAPVVAAWVEKNPDLEWRWIQWIQIIIIAAYLPCVPFMPETRSAVLLRQQSSKMRRQQRQDRAQGKDVVEGNYLARSDVNKPPLRELLKVSLTRPLREFRRVVPSALRQECTDHL